MPPTNSPSATPAYSPVSTSPYLEQLEAISTPVPNFAATLIGSPEANDADDDNVSFLRTSLRLSPDSPSSYQHRGQQPHSPEEELENIDMDDQRNVRMVAEFIHRVPRVVRRQREGSNTTPGYEAHLSNVRSLYGWAPGSDDDDDERRYDPPLLGSGGPWFGPGSDQDPARNGSNSRGSRREAGSIAGESPEIDGSLFQYGEPAIASEALLQSVRRQSRFSRVRMLQSYLQDRERRGQEPEERNSPTAAPRSRPYRFIPNSRVESYRTLSHGDIRARLHAHRQTYVENPPNPRLNEAIKYLERVRFSNSYEESVSSAAEGGFIQLDYFTCNEDDFVLNTLSIAPPAHCSWLQPGTVFSGSQRAATNGNSQMFSHHLPNPDGSIDPVIVNGSESNRINVHTTSGRRYWASAPYPTNNAGTKEDNWPVKVTIHAVDYNTMTLSGTMEAYNIPDKTSSIQDAHIITFLEGEIIDFNIHTLETTSFTADVGTDSIYWRQLQPFKGSTDDEMIKNLVSKSWIAEKLIKGWILMRWKERCFLTPADARQGLTISGFYYISLCRDTGQIEGLYHDPGSSPYQQLSLKPEHKMMIFPSYDFR